MFIRACDEKEDQEVTRPWELQSPFNVELRLLQETIVSLGLLTTSCHTVSQHVLIKKIVLRHVNWGLSGWKQRNDVT